MTVSYWRDSVYNCLVNGKFRPHTLNSLPEPIKMCSGSCRSISSENTAQDSIITGFGLVFFMVYNIFKQLKNLCMMDQKTKWPTAHPICITSSSDSITTNVEGITLEIITTNDNSGTWHVIDPYSTRYIIWLMLWQSFPLSNKQYTSSYDIISNK